MKLFAQKEQFPKIWRKILIILLFIITIGFKIQSPNIIISPLKSRMQSSRISDSGIIRPCKERFRILNFENKLKIITLLSVTLRQLPVILVFPAFLADLSDPGDQPVRGVRTFPELRGHQQTPGFLSLPMVRVPLAISAKLKRNDIQCMQI